MDLKSKLNNIFSSYNEVPGRISEEFEKDKLSIIVTVYNEELYIERCVESLIQQTYTPKEIILVDDGSSDSSGMLCDLMANKYHEVSCLHIDNGGVSSARKFGLCNSKGEYITFVDADDFISKKNTYELCISHFIDDAEVDIVQYPYVRISFDNKFEFKNIPKLKNDQYFASIRNLDNYILECQASHKFQQGNLSTSICDKIFRRNVAVKMKFVSQYLEDVVANISTYFYAKKIIIETRGEYAYCMRENSSITSVMNQRKSIEEFKSIYCVWLVLDYYTSTKSAERVSLLWLKQMAKEIYLKYGINVISKYKINRRSILKIYQKSSLYNTVVWLLMLLCGMKNFVYLIGTTEKIKSAAYFKFRSKDKKLDIL